MYTTTLNEANISKLQQVKTHIIDEVNHNQIYENRFKSKNVIIVTSDLELRKPENEKIVVMKSLKTLLNSMDKLIKEYDKEKSKRKIDFILELGKR